MLMSEKVVSHIACMHTFLLKTPPALSHSAASCAARPHLFPPAERKSRDKWTTSRGEEDRKLTAEVGVFFVSIVSVLAPRWTPDLFGL